MSPATSSRLGLTLVTLGMLGCGVSEGTISAGDTSIPSEGALVDPNGMAMNGMAMNGMAMNGMAMNGMAMNGMAMNGMAMNGMAMNGLTSTAISFRSWFNNTSFTGQPVIMKYLMICALPAGASATYVGANGVSYTWPGRFGLAPGWATRAPTIAEQNWVSACMLAHVNQLANPTQVSFRVAPAMATVADGGFATTPTEVSAYSFREAAFWGNVFASTRLMVACDARMNPNPVGGLDPTLGILQSGRGCGIDNCGISLAGPCNSPGVCSNFGGVTGGLGPCSTPGVVNATFAEVVTTYRNTSMLCGDGVCSPLNLENKTTCPHDCK